MLQKKLIETMTLNINSKCSTSCNISNSLTSSITDGNMSAEYQTIAENSIQKNLHNKNVDIIINVSNSGLSIVSTHVNKHTYLQCNKTEAEDNLEVVLNTLRNLKNDNDVNLISKSVADNKIIDTWHNDTILLASDSMFNNIDETHLSKNKSIKVSSFGGAKI